MAIDCKLWHDIRFARVFRPILTDHIKMYQLSYSAEPTSVLATHIDLLSSNGLLGTKLGLLATLAIVLLAESITPFSPTVHMGIIETFMFSFWSIKGELSLEEGAVEVPEVLAPDDEDDAALYDDDTAENACAKRIRSFAISVRSASRSV
jgi:hypothetical protein